MANRKNLKEIAYGLSSKFASRYNDVNGYWALGMLYTAAITSDTNTISLNLESGISKEISPRYFTWVLDQLHKQGFARSEIRLAEVVVMFNLLRNPLTAKQIVERFRTEQLRNQLIKESRIPIFFEEARGAPFLCEERLTDDCGAVWSAEYRGPFCAAHDPTWNAAVRATKSRLNGNELQVEHTETHLPRSNFRCKEEYDF